MILDPQETRRLALAIYRHVEAPVASRLVLAILDQAPSRVVTHEDLIDNYLRATDRKREGKMDQSDIAGYFKTLRPILKAAGIPIEINPDYGIGYLIEMPLGYEPPWRREKETTMTDKLTLNADGGPFVWTGYIRKMSTTLETKDGLRTGRGVTSVEIVFDDGVADDPEEAEAMVKQQPDAGGV